MSVSVMARAIAPPVLAIASLACDHPRGVASAADPVASLRASIAARLEIKSALGDRVRAVCADDIFGALHRRAIAVTEQGTPVHLELWLAPDMEAARFPSTLSSPRDRDVLPVPAPSFAAELTATVHTAGARPTVFRVAGTSPATPCAAAGERLAAQLIALLGTR